MGRLTDMGSLLNVSVKYALALRRRARMHKTDALQMVENALNRAALTLTPFGTDVYLWRHGTDKFHPSFSSLITWDQIQNRRDTVEWCKGVWFTHATPKFIFLTWIANQPTVYRFSYSKLEPRCFFGLHTLPLHSRNTKQSLFACQFASQVWSEIAGEIFDSGYTTN